MNFNLDLDHYMKVIYQNQQNLEIEKRRMEKIKINLILNISLKFNFRSFLLVNVLFKLKKFLLIRKR